MISDLIRVLKPLEIILNESVILASGKPADFYFDVKKAYGYPGALNMIADELFDKIDKRVSCIAASGYGGLSLATAISSRHNLNLVLVRDTPKKHGKAGWIDGYVPNEQDKIAVIDDVFTTGGSLRKLIQTLETTQAKILGAYVVVKRGEGELTVPLTYLLTPEDFL